MKKGQMFVNVALLLGLGILSTAGWASCSLSGGSAGRYSSPLSGTLTIPRDRPAGSTLGSVISIANMPSNSARTSCSATNYRLFKYGSTMTESSYTDIYATNVPGIGFKVSNNNSNTYVARNAVGLFESFSRGTAYYPFDLDNLKLRFYITGPINIEDGPVKLNFTVQGYASESKTSTSGGVLFAQVTVTGTFPIAYSSCTTPDIKVDLKKHGKSDFPAPGATSPATPFNFEINNCGKGLNSVSYTFTPASGINLVNADSSNQYLTLKSNSRASGVGIQLLYANDTIVPFNSKTTFTGYSATTGGDYTIPMKARYIRTGDITPGSANSAVEFVMAYE